jgi:hypothetical protein
MLGRIVVVLVVVVMRPVLETGPQATLVVDLRPSGATTSAPARVM